jgi:Zn-dependent metalloprotease
VFVRGETGTPSSDGAVNRLFDGLGVTRQFYKDIFDRNSIDGEGLRLNGYVHYGDAVNNAIFDGRNMLFGDGDGIVFTDFTKSIDVIAHELTHGVVQFTADLKYEFQPGALNESVADVFGSLVKQWSLRQTAAEADWLIGSDITTPMLAGDALRSMKAPGTAHDNAILGKDPQPDHMTNFVVLPLSDDQGGVHINSGIPNKAFYLTAIGIGGHAWDAAGHIWYEALKASTENTQFQEFAETTVAKADQLYGASSDEKKVVFDAWREVGIRVPNIQVGRRKPREREYEQPGREAESLAALTRKVEQMSTQLATIMRELGTSKGRPHENGSESVNRDRAQS